LRRLISLLIVMMLLANSLCSATAVVSEYLLGVGDVLNIQVVGLDASSISNTSNTSNVSAATVNYNNGTSGYMIRPDGRFEFPLIGEVYAVGKTPSQLNKEITDMLIEYIKFPRVAINVVKFHTTRVYALGEVVKPGLYEMDLDPHLLDAIGIAGGYTELAAKKTVFVIRNGQKDKPLVCNLLNFIEKADLSQNIELYDGDVVYLSNNGKINWTQDIFPWFQAASNVVTTVGTIYAIQGR